MTQLADLTTDISDWIMARLEAQGGALTGVGIHVGVADNDQPRPRRNEIGPYVTVRHIASADWYYVGGRIGGAVSNYEVTAWDIGNDVTRLKPIAASIHSALQKGRGSSGETYIMACLRGAAIERMHTEEDPPFTQLGGEYIIRTSTP